MALKLCLHGVRIAHPETFTEDVAKLLKLTVKQGKLREKEYGENLSARFRRSKLLGGPLQPVKVRVMEGILLVDSHLSDLLDVEFSYRAGSEELVLTAVQQRSICTGRSSSSTGSGICCTRIRRTNCWYVSCV